MGPSCVFFLLFSKGGVGLTGGTGEVEGGTHRVALGAFGRPRHPPPALAQRLEMLQMWGEK